MRLTPEQSQQIINHLERKQVSGCSVCSSRSWAVGETVFEVGEFFQSSADAASGHSLRMPVIAVTCRNCGHLDFFNAMLLGIIPQG
jgi:hypothetical protein